MVRILKVTELSAKKRELLARSEIHRQTLTLEITNVKLSWALLKKRMRVLKTVYRMFGWAVPVSGLLFGSKKKEESPRSSFITRLLSGFNLASRIKSFFNGAHAEEHQPEEAGEEARY